MVDKLELTTHDGDSFRDSESGSYCGYLTDTSNSVFCTDCQQYGYTQLSQGTTEVGRGHNQASRLESDDSGIRIPARSISDDGENEKKIVPTYLQVISGSKVSIAADLVDSVCRDSDCRDELKETQEKQSMLRLCSNCQALGHAWTDHDTAPHSAVEDRAPRTGSGSGYYNLGRRKPLPGGLQLDYQGEAVQHRHKLEPLDSSDSGIKMTSVDSDQTWEHKNFNEASGMDCLPRSKCVESREGNVFPQSAYCQLSAHPKNRAFFEYLGISESDV